METTVPMFLQYGAMGILALAFIVLLVLFVRTDKRSQQYADLLASVSFDRKVLIEVVTENTRANAGLADRIADLIVKLGERIAR